jgi:hypothetical protein
MSSLTVPNSGRYPRQTHTSVASLVQTVLAPADPPPDQPLKSVEHCHDPTPA